MNELRALKNARSNKGANVCERSIKVKRLKLKKISSFRTVPVRNINAKIVRFQEEDTL